MHEGAREHALIAASPDESSAVVAGILTFGILWLDWAREHNDKRAVEGLRVFVPEGRSRFIRERALGLAPTVRLEIFEFNEREGTVRKMDAADVGNLQSRLVARMGAESALAGAQDVMNCVRSLAADSGPRNGIAARVVAGTKEVAFCFRGLEVGARWWQKGITFGPHHSLERLTERTGSRLPRLMSDVNIYRSSLADDTNHWLCRAA